MRVWACGCVCVWVGGWGRWGGRACAVRRAPPSARLRAGEIFRLREGELPQLDPTQLVLVQAALRLIASPARPASRRQPAPQALTPSDTAAATQEAAAAARPLAAAACRRARHAQRQAAASEVRRAGEASSERHAAVAVSAARVGGRVARGFRVNVEAAAVAAVARLRVVAGWLWWSAGSRGLCVGVWV